MQGFWEKYYPNAVRRGDFFQNPKGADLAGQKDTELPLPNEIGVGSLKIENFMYFEDIGYSF
jgi:hypothetical protein